MTRVMTTDDLAWLEGVRGEIEQTTDSVEDAVERMRSKHDLDRVSELRRAANCLREAR